MSIEDINITGTAYWYKQTDDKKKQRTIQMLVFLTLSWYIKVSPQNKEIKLRNIEFVQDEFILLFEIC